MLVVGAVLLSLVHYVLLPSLSDESESVVASALDPARRDALHRRFADHAFAFKVSSWTICAALFIAQSVAMWRVLWKCIVRPIGNNVIRFESKEVNA
jgi:hypothetical protein